MRKIAADAYFLSAIGANFVFRKRARSGKPKADDRKK